jgi:hypothetical protein
MHVNLRNAYLCADCDAIGDSPEQCPACASRLGILPLVIALNRTLKATMIPKELIHVEVRGIDSELLWSGYASDHEAAHMAAKE